MKFNDYQDRAIKLNVSLDDPKLREILVLGLVGEAGEVAEKWKKMLAYHDGKLTDIDIEEIGKEIGDVIWYAATLAHSLGLSFGDIASRNLAKLEDRYERGVIKGKGDNR